MAPLSDIKNGQPQHLDGDIFIINVKLRKNATWQGTVRWGAETEELRFRSTLELLKIMDSAITTRHPEDDKGGE